MSKDKSSGVFNDLDKEMEKSTDERFLRLEEDGDKALVFFAGEPYSRYPDLSGLGWTTNPRLVRRMRAEEKSSSRYECHRLQR